jgi:hypothetical protein
MNKPGKPADDATQIVSTGRDGRDGADMDALVTTIRSVTAGRLVVVEGAGKGRSVEFFNGSNSIGRDGVRNVVTLDFGDASIHREHHAFLTVKDGVCHLHDNGKRNPIKINGQMLEGTQTVTASDVIEIGATKLRIELA